MTAKAEKYLQRRTRLRPEVGTEQNSYSEMQIDDLLQKAVAEAEEFEISYHV